MSLTNYEQETIINWNKEEKIAYIFTYEKTWQQHLEGKLGLKPVDKNGHGGRSYQIDKKRIPMPRVPRKLSAETKKRLVKQLANLRQKSILSRETPIAVLNQKDKTSNK